MYESPINSTSSRDCTPTVASIISIFGGAAVLVVGLGFGVGVWSFRRKLRELDFQEKIERGLASVRSLCFPMCVMGVWEFCGLQDTSITLLSFDL